MSTYKFVPLAWVGSARAGRFSVALWLAGAWLVGAQTDPGPYVKKGTWTETMLASRAAYTRVLAEARQRAAVPEVKPFETELVSGTGPGQQVSVNVAGQRWLRLIGIVEQGVGNCHIWGEAKLIAKDGTVTWLDGLKPLSVRVGWGQLLVNLNWQNQTLQIKDRKFAHGIWVHANSDVCYALEGKYERFEAWVGMDVARQHGAARFKVRFTEEPDLGPEIAKRIVADFPAQTKWLDRDLSEWLREAGNTQIEQEAIRRVLRKLGSSAGELRNQFEGLKQAKAPADDARWLNLFARVCRYRECRVPLDKVWIADLHRLLEAQFQELLAAQALAEDPRWDALQTKMERVTGVLKPAKPMDLATLRASIQNLAAALPQRFQIADPFWRQLNAKSQDWEELFAAAAHGEEAALERLASVDEEVRQLRRSVLLAFRGMSDFLASPAAAGMDREWEGQYEALVDDIRRRDVFTRVAAGTFRTEALILESDRDPADVVLCRTAALVADLKRISRGAELAQLENELAAVQSANAAVDVKNSEARYLLFAEACRVRRQIALRNPLLNFDALLFIKHHRSLYSHMCDQYYGMAATPGGALCVLANPFGPNPQLRDVLAGSLVQRGRLRGQKLSGGPSRPPKDLSYDGEGNLNGLDGEGGTFLSPDLSFDGKRILFAYVENQGDKRHRHHTDSAQGHWFEGRCFHVFKVDVDGSNLEQLTDGTWNDFDPCWLPNGRVAFISERRGGYLRCGRVCPTYTLFDMAGDGSDLTCLSFHETNEWQPSVTHDGRIVYTRWDYVDRHGCTAHMPWITTLDGRDSRAVHGNFAPRGSRPDMELDCRPIPGSHRFVATAAPHHGQAYGSLVIIDPHVPDDDAMGPVKRLTPEVGFPESQGGFQVYGTPWPLSEDYYLCVYDSTMQSHPAFQGSDYLPGNYGIYLVDTFGNKELIYRDVDIACLSPIPVQPRAMPPPTPEMVERGPETNPATRTAPLPGSKPPEGVISVLNVYDSMKPWPAGTRITALRVLQVLPMSVPSGGPPHATAFPQPYATDSTVPVRYVLGTVPVEEDGSAYFIVPANKEIFFQALDEQGLAVQSMRSATYLHEGEHLSCAGCHDRRSRAPLLTTKPRLALRRAPSRLMPDVAGSNPFSYPQLVQPVLNRNCVECHQKHSGQAPNLTAEPTARHWYASYDSLVPSYGFIDYGDALRTTPGHFGARASKLYAMLRKGHHDVNLSAEDLHRLTLWLDCASMFYGVYEKAGGMAQLRGEIAQPTLE